MTRTKPNILVTGTPGVGKSNLCQEIIKNIDGFEWIDISDLAKKQHFLDSYDPELESHVLDEDKLLDELEPRMGEGGKILDYHSSEMFPERWIDHVYVLRAKTEILFDRLTARGYNSKKVDQNIQCEIFQVLLDEANESYNPSIVTELQSNDDDDAAKNINVVMEFLKNWTPKNSS
ncbi:unnamed protein product [Bemisia tabaci]|uniref:Adenylate kinase isoenzyme 6 homolog n=1 Tax=Bemisia tabaci TaxID=7038 RepID=A0A9P0F859_BEMTA|nr:PREDICTED: adenylate kinase isoenzyme 6 [Bemisia tabaci]CAH0391941.1 unnamed protein product [Bemisia tabaci]